MILQTDDMLNIWSSETEMEFENFRDGAAASEVINMLNFWSSETEMKWMFKYLGPQNKYPGVQAAFLRKFYSRGTEFP